MGIRGTSRPLLLAAVGRATYSAGQTTLYLTPLHGKVGLLKSRVANIREALQHVKDAAEQFKTTDRWAVLLRYVSDKIAPTIRRFRFKPPNVLSATG
jgi:predicted HAD superfamily phosphohydrolase